VATIGLSEEPALLEVRDGRLAGARGRAGEQLLARLRQHGDQGTNLAELGVGTNDRAMLTGNVLEDEKVLGTVHVAFGASAGIGGTVSVPVHLDCVVREPTLTADDVTVVERGRFVLA
jgi:leucyl aminopeptidase (aminopeptidase T)